MGFVNPFILWALAFLSVPIILQFLLQRRRVVIKWAAYEWMRKAIVIRRKQVRITEILKLISKLLLILFLVLLVARPLTRSAMQGRTLLVMDTTLSMSASLEAGTRLDKARTLVAEHLKRTDAPAAVYAFNGRLVPVLKLQKQNGAVESVLKGVDVTPRAASVRDFIEAVTADAVFREVDTVIFISDFQKESWRDPRIQEELAERIGKVKRLVLMPVDPRSGLLNLAIESAVIPPEGYFPGRSNRLGVVVRNYADQPVNGVPVTVFADGQKTDRAMVSLDARSAKTVWLNLPTPQNRETQVRVELPPDVLLADNEYNLVLDPGSEVNVLALTRPQADEIFPVDLFFRSSMNAYMKGDFLKYKAVRPNDLLNENLGGYDLVIGFGTAFGPRDRVTERLKDFLKAGKGVLAFADPADAQGLSGFGVPALKMQEGALVQPDAKRLQGGYLEFMGGGGLNPSLVHFSRFAPLAGAGQARDGRLYLAGVPDPVVVSRDADGGRLVMAGFLPYPGYTDFFYNPNFVPFSMQMVWEALNRNVCKAFTGDEVGRIPLDTLRPSAVYTVRSAAGDQARMELHRQEGKSSLSMPLFKAGTVCTVYEDKDPLFTFGYNLSRSDSDVEPVLARDLAPARAKGVIVDEKQSFSAGKARRERLWIMLTLALAAVAFEFYAHLMRKR